MAMRVPDPLSSHSFKLQTELWSSGPTPGSLYHLPAGGTPNSTQCSATKDPFTHTL